MTRDGHGLVVIETHPIQYHAPLWRLLERECGVPVTVIYGSDFSVHGYRDAEFGTTFRWDVDLLSGYRPVFLERVAQGGARHVGEVSAKHLRWAIKQAAPAAILLVGYSPSFYAWAILESVRTGCPLLFRGETTDHTKARGAIKAAVRDGLLRWLYSRCARLLYVGRRSREHFQRLGCPETKLVFAPYGVDTTAFALSEDDHTRLRGPARADLGIAQTDIALLFCGKLYDHKRPDLVLSAAKMLDADTRVRIVALFVGTGNEEGHLRMLAVRPPQVRAHFLGFRNQTELSRVYHASDLLVLPSRSETWGLVVNEALHHGVPCVVSEAVGCAPDLIESGRTGEVCEMESAAGLASALTRAIAWCRRPGVREDCCARANEYTLARAARGITQAYGAVTAGALQQV